MKVLKTIIKYILAIILAIAILAYFFVNLASSTILSEKYILSKLDETDYYNKIYEYAKSNFENYIYQSGLDESVIEEIVTKEKVKKDTQIIISNVYDGKNQQIDTQEIRDNLNKNINNTLKNQKLTTTQRESIDTFIEHICNEYTDTMSHFGFEKNINQIYQQGMKYIDISKKVLLITIGVDFLLLIVLNLKRIYKAVSLVGISLTITGMILLIINFFINRNVNVQIITILNNAVSDVIRNILNEILSNTLFRGIILAVIGIILIIGANLLHNIRKYGNAREEDTYENG